MLVQHFSATGSRNPLIAAGPKPAQDFVAATRDDVGSDVFYAQP